MPFLVSFNILPNSSKLDFQICYFWYFFDPGLQPSYITPNHTNPRPFLGHFDPFCRQQYQKVNGFDLKTHIPWTDWLSWVEIYLSHPLTNLKNIILVQQTFVEPKILLTPIISEFKLITLPPFSRLSLVPIGKSQCTLKLWPIAMVWHLHIGIKLRSLEPPEVLSQIWPDLVKKLDVVTGRTNGQCSF